jgi:hypothetical protein
MYSVALGTLELTLYQQLHLFNVLYNNDLVERPADHPSLVIDKILLNGDSVQINDTVRRYHPFADVNNLRPTYLGMHKRLAGKADGLGQYDIAVGGDSAKADAPPASFREDVLPLSQPPSNYAKSGTTDDVIEMADGAKGVKKTNYGLWNATIRIDLSKLPGHAGPQDVRDITIACIGECNEHYTGPRDGKTLHKFVSSGLLRQAGIPAPGGYYSQYEAYLRRCTPEYMKNCQDSASAITREKAKDTGTGGIFSGIRTLFRKKGK